MAITINTVINALKNGYDSESKTICIKGIISKKSIQLLSILQQEGYINNFTYSINKKKEVNLIIHLKYTREGIKVMQNIVQISRPGKRIYTTVKPLWKIKGGFGLFIISTIKGLKTDFDARLLNLGGELICSVI